MAKEILPDEYLDKNFDYSKCTKEQLRRIMFDNDVSDIPPTTAKKSEIVALYKRTIHDNIDVLKKKHAGVVADGRDISNFSDENVFQSEDGHDHDEKVFSSRRGRSGASNVDTPRRGSVIMESKSPLKSVMDNSSLKMSANEIFWNKSGFRGQDPDLEKYTPKIKSRIREKPSRSDEGSDSKNPFLDTRSIRKVSNKSPRPVKENPNLPRFVKHTPRRRQWFFVIYLLITALFLLFLRFFCPYCTDGSLINIFSDPLNPGNYCIPVPGNSTIRNGMVECKPGFRLAWYSFIKKKCVMDKKKEKEREKQIRELIGLLKRARTEYEYGFRSSPKIPLAQIKAPEEIMNIILTYREIKKDQTHIYSTEPQFSFRIVMRFYLSRILKIIGIPLLILAVTIGAIKYYLATKRRKKENNAKANEILKRVMNTLTSQVLFHSRDSKIDPFIPIAQLKDLFPANKSVWKIVIERIRNNSNVREYSGVFKGEKHMVWEYVGPSVFSHIGIKSDEEVSSYVDKNLISK